LLPASRRRASAAIDVRPFPPAKSFLSRPDGRDQRNGPDALGSREVTAGPRPLDQVLASGSHYAEDMTESPLLSSACVGWRRTSRPHRRTPPPGWRPFCHIRRATDWASRQHDPTNSVARCIDMWKSVLGWRWDLLLVPPKPICSP